MNSVLIMSSERSGSNLLRKMLGSHSAISAPVPPHLWSHLTALLPFYGSLAEDANFEALARAAISMTNVPNSHLAWGYDLELAAVLPKIRVRNLTGLIGALYEDYAQREGASVWVSKENNLFDHAYQIRDVYPEARFIYLCRDGRDYAVSVKNVPSHDQHVYFIAQEWRAEQMKCAQVYQELVTRGAALLVRYEDLIENPEMILRDVCAFIGVDFENKMLNFHAEEQTQKEAGMTQYWKNISRPVMRDNKAKFLNELTPDEIALFESIAGDALRLLGYPLVGQATVKPGRAQRLIYGIQNALAKRRQKAELMQEAGRRERADMLTATQAVTRGAIQPLAGQIQYEGLRTED